MLTLIKIKSYSYSIRKILSILILSIFIYNTFGFLAVHPFLSLYYKYLGMQRTNVYSEEEIVELLVFNKEDIINGKINFQWIHSREFKYNGDLYDIIENNVTEEQLIIYCINDTREKKLEEDFEKRVQKNSFEDKQKPVTNLLKFVSISEPVQFDKATNSLVKTSSFGFRVNEFYQSYNLDIPTPPPRLV